MRVVMMPMMPEPYQRLASVVNVRTSTYDVYCGRPGPLGNPFQIGMRLPGGKLATRADVVRMFETNFMFRVENDARFAKYVVDTCRGKTLGCYCKPLACHADVIAKWVNAQPDAQP